MGCTQAGFEALAREIRQAQRRQEAMLERRRQRVEDRKRRLERGAIVDNGPVEDLVWSRCRTHYAFGDNCPSCGADLVCAAWADSCRVPVRPNIHLGNMPVLGTVLVGAALFGSIALVGMCLCGLFA